jgi:hypothetical protein
MLLDFIQNTTEIFFQNGRIALGFVFAVNQPSYGANAQCPGLGLQKIQISAAVRSSAAPLDV